MGNSDREREERRKPKERDRAYSLIFHPNKVTNGQGKQQRDEEEGKLNYGKNRAIHFLTRSVTGTYGYMCTNNRKAKSRLHKETATQLHPGIVVDRPRVPFSFIHHPRSDLYRCYFT